MQNSSQTQTNPLTNPAIFNTAQTFATAQTLVPQHLLSNPEKISNQKNDIFFNNITKDESSFRKTLSLNDPPIFFNPFVLNNGYTIPFYNPFYTRDVNKLSLNMNGYLFRRFSKINVDEKLKFFSDEEDIRFTRSNYLKIIIYFSFAINTFLFFRTRLNRYFLINLINGVLITIPIINDRIIFYNSYLRNFNGYSDEQVDYILTLNSKEHLKQIIYGQIPENIQNLPDPKI